MLRALVAVGMIVASARAVHAGCPRLDKTIAVARGPITVDGVLDDATWRDACFATDFEQKQPAYGKPPTHPVKVAVAIDGSTLYVGARMWSAGRADIDDALTQRDDTSQAERFIVSIDPSHTRRIAYSFAVTARGVRADWIHTDDSEFQRDASWNPVWVAKARMLDDGWSAELAIPLSQLRLPREPATSWGIDFNWYIPHRNEDVFWRAVPRERTAWASYFGELVELPPIRPGLALELLPYAATKLIVDEAPAGALGHRWRAGFEAGLDAKLRPLPGLTIAATINPDFGQVDADPAFVNLTAYEVQLAEKRPFFVENNALFADGDTAGFYSRRIGGLPRFVPAADAIDLPAEARILGAVAVGGYVEPHTQIASLVAVTDRASADAIVSGRRTDLVVAPLTAWAAGRVEHQVGTSVLAAEATAVQRALGGTGLGDLLAPTALYLSTDDKLRTCDSTYELDPFLAGSAVFGTAASIATLARSPTHYFQRPDQPHVHLDPAARAMLGWAGGLAGSKRDGLHRASALLGFESPGLEVNDLGVLASADNINLSLAASRNVTTPTKHVFAWSLSTEANAGWNFGGLLKPTYLSAASNVTFASFSNMSASATVVTPGASDDLTRGGPVMRTGWGAALALGATTPNGRAHQLSGNLELDVSPTLNQGVVASAHLVTRLTPALRLDVTPSITAIATRRQYVATVEDPAAAATYGARYVFGSLARKEAALELRATWSLSPDLVVTLYAQPFVSVGRYDALGELAAAGSSDVRWYASTLHTGDTRTIVDDGSAPGFVPMFSIDEPDYAVASLRSTAVLRWEPAPGSTLFVVWQQSRGGVPAAAARPLHGVAPDVFTQPAVHTLAIKLSYWFG